MRKSQPLDNGIVLYGRGNSFILDEIGAALEDFADFDEAVENLSDTVKDVFHSILIDSVKDPEFPIQGYQDELVKAEGDEDAILYRLMDEIPNLRPGLAGFFMVEPFIVGYSEKNNSMGLATAMSHTLNGKLPRYELQTIFKTPIRIFIHQHIYRQWAKKHGREPYTDQEMIAVFKKVFEYDCKRPSMTGSICKPGGGNVEKTTVYKDGTITVEDMGPIQRDLKVITGGKVGRNSPCPCGSDKKYKKCCEGK